MLFYQKLQWFVTFKVAKVENDLKPVQLRKILHPKRKPASKSLCKQGARKLIGL